jgi:general secretion pathway protein G
MNSQSVHQRSGFSLMEIMIVVMIIGLFVAVGGSAIYRQLEKAKKTNARATLRTLHDAITTYNQETYQYPQTLNDLIKDPQNVKGWEGPYLQKSKALPKDPWGKPFQYQVTEGNAENPYELYSFGGPKGKSEPKKNNIRIDEE